MALIRAPVVAILVLLAVGLSVTHTSAAAPRCCTTYTPSKIPFAVIRGYYIQTSKDNCRISAIIFNTKKGRNVCTDPALPWVMDYVSRLGSRAHNVHNKAVSQPQ